MTILHFALPEDGGHGRRESSGPMPWWLSSGIMTGLFIQCLVNTVDINRLRMDVVELKLQNLEQRMEPLPQVEGPPRERMRMESRQRLMELTFKTGKGQDNE